MTPTQAIFDSPLARGIREAKSMNIIYRGFEIIVERDKQFPYQVIQHAQVIYAARTESQAYDFIDETKWADRTVTK